MTAEGSTAPSAARLTNSECDKRPLGKPAPVFPKSFLRARLAQSEAGRRSEQ